VTALEATPPAGGGRLTKAPVPAVVAGLAFLVLFWQPLVTLEEAPVSVVLLSGDETEALRVASRAAKDVIPALNRALPSWR
jgi:hypothetical protein